MKKLTDSFCRVVLLSVICCIIFWLSGCKGPQPGETAAAVDQRRLRKSRIEQEQFRHDVDKLFLTDKPSTLSDKRVR